METKDVISVQLFCSHYKISASFIDLLIDNNLIHIVTLKKTPCIYKDQIKRIEKMIRLHHELDINIEGIDVINNLLEQIEKLQKESLQLRNRLGLYED
jgi:hypothetical protein